MTVQIPYGEAWLLETLAMCRLPVCCLTRNEEEMRSWLLRGFHKLSPTDLRRTLRMLFDAGDIEAFGEDDDHGFRPSDAQLSAAYTQQDKKMYCHVTHSGGMRWESLANPDWSRYFDDFNWDGERVQLTAGSHERLLEIVNGSTILWHSSMDAASLDIECVRPWEAFAWKTLPVGFRSNVPYHDIPFVLKSREEVVAEYKKTWPRRLELRTWAKSICGHAYV